VPSSLAKLIRFTRFVCWVCGDFDYRSWWINKLGGHLVWLVSMHKTNCLKIYIDNIHISMCIYIYREKDKMNIYIIHKRFLIMVLGCTYLQAKTGRPITKNREPRSMTEEFNDVSGVVTNQNWWLFSAKEMGPPGSPITRWYQTPNCMVPSVWKFPTKKDGFELRGCLIWTGEGD